MPDHGQLIYKMADSAIPAAIGDDLIACLRPLFSGLGLSESADASERLQGFGSHTAGRKGDECLERLATDMEQQALASRHNGISSCTFLIQRHLSSIGGGTMSS